MWIVMEMWWLLKNRVNLRCKCNELFEIVRKIKVFETPWLYRYYVIYVLCFYWYHIVCIILSWNLHFWTKCNYPVNRGYFTLKQCVAFLKCCGCVPLTHHQFFSNLPSHFHPLSLLLYYHFFNFFLNHQIVQVFLPFQHFLIPTYNPNFIRNLIRKNFRFKPLKEIFLYAKNIKILLISKIQSFKSLIDLWRIRYFM